MKSPEHIPSNQVLLLGRGVDRIDDSNGYSLSRASHARAMAAARYHADHRLWFGAHDSRIVVSGGYAGVAADQEAPPVEFREARLMRKVMMEAGVPGPLIEVEDQSVSTTDNFAKVLENGFFAGQEFTNVNPLLIVGSGQHVVRRGIPLARAAFDITEQRGVLCLPAEGENIRTRAQEVLLGAMTKRAIEQINPEPWNAEDMGHVGARLEAVVKGTPEADGMTPWPMMARLGEIAVGTVQYLPHLRQDISAQYLAA